MRSNAAFLAEGIASIKSARISPSMETRFYKEFHAELMMQQRNLRHRTE